MITEIKIDKSTLPDDGKKVRFHLFEKEEWMEGTYESENELFVHNSRKWYSIWDVDQWEYINNQE